MRWIVLAGLLAGCGGGAVGTWQDCAPWPTGAPTDVAGVLDLAQQGKEAHGDCQARYNALRKATATGVR